MKNWGRILEQKGVSYHKKCPKAVRACFWYHDISSMGTCIKQLYSEFSNIFQLPSFFHHPSVRLLQRLFPRLCFGWSHKLNVIRYQTQWYQRGDFSVELFCWLVILLFNKYVQMRVGNLVSSLYWKNQTFSNFCFFR